MGDVIITDDTAATRESLKEAISLQGHTCHSTFGADINQWVSNTLALVDKYPDCVLLLDFNMRPIKGGESWSGIWLYLRLRDCGALSKCRRVIVASKYVPNYDIRKLKSAEAPTDPFIARVFVECEQIPSEDVLRLDVAEGYSRVADRITQVYKEDILKACPRCGNPNV